MVVLTQKADCQFQIPDRRGSDVGIFVYCTILLSLISCSDHGIAPPDGAPGVGPEPPPVPTYFDHPAWHPQGRWIAAEHADSVDSDGDGRLDRIFGGIWLIHAETGATHPLLSGFGLPAWSPDGRKLAMVSGAQIYTVTVLSLFPPSIDSSSLKQLTTDGANFYPAWSPDGECIAYDSDLNDLSGPYVIWKMMGDGNNKREIGRQEYGGSRLPNWSTNGSQIVYQRYYPDVQRAEIAIMDTSGKNPVRLTRDDSDDFHPKYSPDGGNIAFYSKPRVGPPAIWAMSPDGTNLRKVSPDYVWRFDWSPDGSKFVFLYANYTDRCHSGNGQLWILNTDGSGLRQLTYFSR